MSSRPALTVLRDVFTRAPVFTTEEVARTAHISMPEASRTLARMQHQGLILRLVRGLWAVPQHPDFSPYSVVPYLVHGHRVSAGPPHERWDVPIDIEMGDSVHVARRSLPASSDEPSAYVSFVSALHLHGMLSQIPQEIHIAVRQQRETVTTPVATYRFHLIGPDLFGGTIPGDRWARFHLATPAKALVDTLYASVHRGRAFSHLPELELPYAALPGRTAWTGADSANPSPLHRLRSLEHETTQWIERIRSPRTQRAVRDRWLALLPTLLRALTGE